MKYILKSFVALSLFCLAFIATSCSNNEVEDVNYAAKIVGEYVGTIEITYYGSVIEKSKGAKLNLTRSSNNFVNASFRYADGSSVFNSGNVITYKITKSSTGTYILLSDDSSIEEIRINGKTAETVDAYITVTFDGESDYCDFSFTGTKQ